MTLSVKHAFQSAKVDGGDTALVRPSNWNAEHTIECAQDKILGRSSSGAGAVQEITCTAAGRALIDDADAAAQRTTLGITYPVPTAGIVDDAVTLAKIAAFGGASKLLGAGSGGADPAEIALGDGLSMETNTLKAVPPMMAGAQGLVIVNNTSTPNSQIDMSADQVIASTSGNALSKLGTSISGTCNTSTTGADGLDASSRVADTWYNFFFIYNPTTDDWATLASLSATAPTLPSGYTYFVRVGAMRTDGSGNFYRSRQRGNKVQYNGSTGPRQVTTTAAASVAALSLANFVPPTATGARVSTYSSSVQNSGQLIALGSVIFFSIATAQVSYQGNLGGSISTSTNAMTIAADIVFDAAVEVYRQETATGIDIRVHGWTDKVNAS